MTIQDNVRGTMQGIYGKTGTSTSVPTGAFSYSAKPKLVYLPDKDTLYSGGNGTGLSFRLRYAEDSTQENPIILASGVDENGKKFEQRIEVDKVNLSHATIVEIRAVQAHYHGDTGVSLHSLPQGMGELKLRDRVDLFRMFEKSIADMRRMGRFDSALLFAQYLDFYRAYKGSHTNFASPKDNVGAKPFAQFIQEKAEQAQRKQKQFETRVQETKAQETLQTKEHKVHRIPGSPADFAPHLWAHLENLYAARAEGRTIENPFSIPGLVVLDPQELEKSGPDGAYGKRTQEQLYESLLAYYQKSFYERLLEAFEADKTFQFFGEEKVYDLYEYAKEWERRNPPPTQEEIWRSVYGD